MALLVDQLQVLKAEFNTLVDHYVAQSSVSNGQASEQARFLASIASVAKRIEHATTPPSARVFMIGLQRCEFVALRVAVELELFKIIDRDGISLDDLAAMTGADRNLLVRILRVLVADSYILETGTGNFCATPLSKAIVRPELSDWIRFLFDISNKIHSGIPEFLAMNGFKDMNDLSHNVSINVLGDNLYDYLEKDPASAATFAGAMKIQDTQPSWVRPVYPFSEDDLAGETKTQSPGVYIVDVGGGEGQFLESLLRERPSLPGRFVTQDLESVHSKDQVPRDPRIETQAYDFFTPQPVMGAKYYFFRSIFHNWPDAESLAILANVREAMEPGYSKVLICDTIIPVTGYTRREALADINMMNHCGRERTEQDFHSLLQRAGLRITNIHRAELGSRSIIEAEIDSS